MKCRNLVLIVKGNKETYFFPIGSARQDIIDKWRKDGLEIEQMEYRIPEWVDNFGYGASSIWCFIQDMFSWIRLGKEISNDEQ